MYGVFCLLGVHANTKYTPVVREFLWWRGGGVQETVSFMGKHWKLELTPGRSYQYHSYGCKGRAVAMTHYTR